MYRNNIIIFLSSITMLSIITFTKKKTIIKASIDME